MVRLQSADKKKTNRYLCAVAGALRSVSQWKSLQESKEALDEENHSIPDLHQILAREIKLLFLLFIIIYFHLITSKKFGFSFKYTNCSPKPETLVNASHS